MHPRTMAVCEDGDCARPLLCALAADPWIGTSRGRCLMVDMCGWCCDINYVSQWHASTFRCDLVRNFRHFLAAWCGWIGCSLSFCTSVETSPLLRSLTEAGHPALKPLKDKKFAMSSRCLSHNPHDVQKLHQHTK